MTFTYRIGEVLRRCLEMDALGHVLTLSWLVRLYYDTDLIGAHPGVDIFHDGQQVGEADVLLLFQDGTMTPVEVKLRGRGFDASEAVKLDRLSDLRGAEYDLISVLEPDHRCDTVKSFKRQLPDRPRFLLTMNHLANVHPFWAMGANPFKLSDTASDDEDPRQRWLSAVANMDDMPTDWATLTINHWRDT